MHTQCTYPYTLAIESELGWTSFVVLTLFISIIHVYGGLAHFMYIWKEAIHRNRHADQDADNRA